MAVCKFLIVFSLVITLILSIANGPFANASTTTKQQGTFTVKEDFKTIERGQIPVGGVIHTVVTTRTQDYKGTVVMDNFDATTLRLSSVQGTCKFTVNDNGVITKDSFTLNVSPVGSSVSISFGKLKVNIGAANSEGKVCAWSTNNIPGLGEGISVVDSNSGITAKGEISVKCSGGGSLISCSDKFSWDFNIPFGGSDPGPEPGPGGVRTCLELQTALDRINPDLRTKQNRLNELTASIDGLIDQTKIAISLNDELIKTQTILLSGMKKTDDLYASTKAELDRLIKKGQDLQGDLTDYQIEKGRLDGEIAGLNGKKKGLEAEINAKCKR